MTYSKSPEPAQQHRTNLGEIRAEMARLTGILMKANRDYITREIKLKTQYGHDLHLLSARLREDQLLADYSGTSKTCAALAGALAQVLMAEVTWFEHHRRARNQDEYRQRKQRSREGQVEAASQNLLAEPPIATRPQDWAEPARRMLFGDSARMRREHEQ